MKTSTKQNDLQQLQQRIVNDGVCPDLAKSATQLVFGDGAEDADLVFIGEAPGKNEDEQGKPFVGAAGKFLNEMLEMIGLKRSDVYITNIVKYRPPNNRDPYPEEKSAFLPYLEAQLDIIQPKLVVTLGRHSLNCFLPDVSISQVHGQPKRFKWMIERSGAHHADEVQGSQDEQATDMGGRKSELMLTLLPLFHPAAALYNGGMRQTLIDDFATIPLILKKLSHS